jgi:hypothetical protein
MTCSASSIPNPDCSKCSTTPLGEHLARIIGHVVLDEPAQEIAAH